MTDSNLRRAAGTRVLVALLTFVAIGALGGGASMLVDTSGATAGLDAALLTRTPFTSYLWPGVLLTLGLGATPLLIVIGIVRREPAVALSPLEQRTGQHWSWTLSIAFGVALVAWIVVQVALIDFSWLQPLMLTVGAAVTVIPFTGPVRRDLAGRGSPVGTRRGR